MKECILTKTIVETVEQCLRLCRLLLAFLVLRGCRGQVDFGSQTRHHLNVSLVIESLSKEQIDIFIREEQLDDADPLRHLRRQDSFPLSHPQFTTRLSNSC